MINVCVGAAGLAVLFVGYLYAVNWYGAQLRLKAVGDKIIGIYDGGFKDTQLHIMLGGRKRRVRVVCRGIPEEELGMVVALKQDEFSSAELSQVRELVQRRNAEVSVTVTTDGLNVFCESPAEAADIVYELLVQVFGVHDDTPMRFTNRGPWDGIKANRRWRLRNQ